MTKDLIKQTLLDLGVGRKVTAAGGFDGGGEGRGVVLRGELLGDRGVQQV